MVAPTAKDAASYARNVAAMFAKKKGEAKKSPAASNKTASVNHVNKKTDDKQNSMKKKVIREEEPRVEAKEATNHTDESSAAGPSSERRASFITAGWVESPDGDSNRVDVPGTGSVNEMAKHNPQALDRYRRAILAHVLYPLHNALQRSVKLHNDDELQMLLMPPAADGTREAFVATNRDRVTQQDVNAAVTGSANLKQLKIKFLRVVTGVPRRHAEQKLLDHAEKIRSRFDFRREKALLVGERLPCAVCRHYAVQFEKWANVLPTHGHLYATTFQQTPGGKDLQPGEMLATLREARMNRVARVGNAAAQQGNGKKGFKNKKK